MDMSDRRRRVLSAIIAIHTDSGEPVGSKSLLDLFNTLSVSSATIRNDMAQLTEEGLLSQPHTSAGRVPTVDGYRYYVDNLIRFAQLSKADEDDINAAIRAMDTDPDKAAEEAAQAMARLTGLAAIATTVRGSNSHIVHFEVMKVGRYNVAVMGVSSAGAIKSRVCRFAAEPKDGDIEQIQNVLNQNAVFVTSEDAGPMLSIVLRKLLPEKDYPAAEAAIDVIRQTAEVRVYTVGQQNLLRFRELEGSMGDILELFSDHDELCRCFGGIKEPVEVYVGDFGRYDGLGQVSLAVSRYRTSGGMTGGLGVAGPVRMNYRFVIPRLRYFCDRLSASLSNQ